MKSGAGSGDTTTAGLSSNTIKALKEKHGVGETTIRDIAEELKRPNRDPRDDYPKPIMQKGVVTFEDLREGMTITGKIKNVVDFGAFVDLGIKETALVHISEMSDRFVKNPLEAVKAGDVMEFRIISLDTERRRIGLSAKSGNRGQEKPQKSRPPIPDPRSPVPTPHSSLPKPRSPTPDPRSPQPRPPKDDDGTMYNPFAEAFKKKKG